jgi:hypothetical protein
VSRTRTALLTALALVAGGTGAVLTALPAAAAVPCTVAAYPPLS